jgi:hypothetical protein
MKKSGTLLSRVAMVTLPLAMLASCGGGTQQANTVIKDPAKLLAETAQKTQATSFKMDGKMIMKMNAGGTEVNAELPISGITDPVAKRQEISMDMTPMMKAISEGMGGGVDLLGELGDMKILMKGIDGTLWMKAGMLTKTIGSDKWVAMNAKDLGIEESELWSGVGGNDPTAGLTYLKGLSGENIQTIGQEKIRGADTTHFRAEVDSEKLAATSASQKKNMEKAGITGTFPMDIWVDSEGRTARTEMEIKGAQAGMDVKITMSVDYFDFGTKVDVTAPADADVVSADSIPGFTEALKQNR